MRKKISAGVAALAIAGGIGVATVNQAVPAEAQTRGSVVVEHTNISPRGLGGSIRIEGSDPDDVRPIYEGSSWVWDNTQTFGVTRPRYLQAGSGYCVWEEVFKNNDTSAGVGPNTSRFTNATKVANVNHGKGYSSRLFEMASYQQRNVYSEGLFSRLRIYSC